MKINNFEDLQFWKDSIEVAKESYKIVRKDSFKRDFYLSDQIRRSTISISSNIAEGFERYGNAEFIRFLKIAKGSCGEARSQFFLAKEVGLIDNDEYAMIKEMLLKIAVQLGAFIKYLHNRKQK